MDIVEQIKKKYTKTSTVHYTLGKDNANGALECGFMRKTDYGGSDLDIVFNYYGALLVLEGSGFYTDEKGIETQLFPGCFIQRIPDRRHSTVIKADGKWLEVFICFGRELYFSLEKIGVINSSKPVLFPGLNSSLVQNFFTLYQELENAAIRQLPTLLAKAMGIVFHAHELDGLNEDKNKNDYIAEACRIIDNSTRTDISPAKIAAWMNVSYESFRKRFKAKMGVSPHFYIIQKKVNAAKSLLLDQDKSMKEIALELGYPDQFAFSKQFKNITGISPRSFRQTFT